MSPQEFIDQLLLACSDIDSDWKEHLDFWEGDTPGFYNDISVIVHYVMSKYKQDDLRDFKDIAQVVERGLSSEVAKTSEIALLGFLEGILFVGSHDDIRSTDHKEWLGVHSYNELVCLESAFEELHNKSSKRDAASGAPS